jgi:NADH dehydrogenase/NADH:ubiquinone oxidoreductase subunit G
MCDDGRLTYRRANENSMTFARIQSSDGENEQVAGEVALEKAVELLKPAQGNATLGAALSMHATMEEAYAFGKLVKDVFEVKRLTLLGFDDWQGDDLLKVNDRNPNRQGILMVLNALGIEIDDGKSLCERIECNEVKALLSVGHECDALDTLSLAAKKLEVVVHLGYAETSLSNNAHVILPVQSWLQTEGTWLNGFNRLQRLRPALHSSDETTSALTWFSAIAKGLEHHFDWETHHELVSKLEEEVSELKEIRLGEIDDQGLVIG